MRPDIELLPIGSLKAPARQARVHSKKQLAKLSASLKAFGFVSPAVIDGQNEIIVGVGRVEAARLIGLTEVPAVRVTHLSEAQIRAFRLADNRLAEDGRWDTLVLAEELLVLSTEPIELITTGFELAEIDRYILEAEQAKPDGQDDALDQIPDLQTQAVTRPGDIWSMDDGRHRVICGDTLDPDTFARLMQADAG